MGDSGDEEWAEEEAPRAHLLHVPPAANAPSPTPSLDSCTPRPVFVRPRPPLSNSSSDEDLSLPPKSKATRRCASARSPTNYHKPEEGRRSKSLDGETSSGIEQHMASKKSELKPEPKPHKTPWSKVKGIIHQSTVGHIRKRPSTDEPIKKEVVEHNSLTAPILTLTLPSTEELTAGKSSPCPPPDGQRVQMQTSELSSPPLQRKGSSKWFKVKNVFLPSAYGSRSAPSSPIRSDSFVYELEGDELSGGFYVEDVPKDDDVFHEEVTDIHDEIQRSYHQLQVKLSQEFQRKLRDWEKMKRVRAGGSGVSSGNSSVADEGPQEKRCGAESLTAEFKKKLEEWDKLKGQKREDKKPIRDEEEKAKTAKELVWLEKELAKVEREKERLEREREKCFERESRLKKMKLAHCARGKEVLIPTSTGMFRFEGISHKFTRKLYEWEKARGITPEASTFVLLDPEYKPRLNGNPHQSGEGLLVRSKSIGSVADLGTGLSSQQIAQQPSSLSLNDMDDLQGPRLQVAEPSCSVEPLYTEASGQRRSPTRFGYSPEEVTKLIDSSDSGSERGMRNNISHSQMVHSSYQLLQENITLLDKLKKEREACRKLENDMKNLEGQIHSVSKSFDQDYDMCAPEDLSHVHYCNQEESMNECNNAACLQDPFFNSSPEGEKMDYTPGHDNEDERRVFASELISEMLRIIERLEATIYERNKEMWKIKCALQSRESCRNPFMSDRIHHWFSAYTLPVGSKDDYNCDELSRFPSLLVSKVHDLKRVLELADNDGRETEQSRASCHEHYPKEEDEQPIGMEPQDEVFSQRSEHECSSPASSFTFHPAVFAREHPHRTWEYESEQYRRSLNVERMLTNSYNMYDEPEHDYYQDISYMENIPQKFSFEENEFHDNETSFSEDFEHTSIPYSDSLLSNVFVPTTRKIFTPVKCEDTGETTVIEIVVDDQITKVGTPQQQENEPFPPTDKGSSSGSVSESSSNKPHPDDIKEETEETQTDLQDNPPAEMAEPENPLYVDIGFPPLSPMHVKREFPKESPSTLRARLAKYKKEQGSSGSGSCSPPFRRSISPDKKVDEVMKKASSVSTLKDPKLTAMPKFSSVTEIQYDFRSDEGDVLSTPDSLRLRALRIKKAKEDFFKGTLQSESSTSLAAVPEKEDSPTIEVSHEDLKAPSKLLVKSASAGIVNVQSMSASASDNLNVAQNSHWYDIFSNRLRKSKPKRRGQCIDAVSTLARQSLMLDMVLNSEKVDSNVSKSCPSSPTLQRPKNETSWIKNPAKIIFRPKGKYTINNK